MNRYKFKIYSMIVAEIHLDKKIITFHDGGVATFNCYHIFNKYGIDLNLFAFNDFRDPCKDYTTIKDSYLSMVFNHKKIEIGLRGKLPFGKVDIPNNKLMKYVCEEISDYVEGLSLFKNIFLTKLSYKWKVFI